MKSVTTKRFRDCFKRLPERVQKRARESYKLWKVNPEHPGLHFKRLQTKRSVFSIRVSLGYRALGVLEEETIVWFWIGSHSDYDKLISTK